MKEHEIDKLDQRYDQFLALREAFASLVYTLSEQGTLDLNSFKNHLDLGSQHLAECGEETASKALTEMRQTLLEEADDIHRLGVARRKREAGGQHPRD